MLTHKRESAVHKTKDFSTGGISPRLKNISSENEVGLPALFPDSRLIPADKILVRPGRFPEGTKNLPLALGGAFQAVDILRVPAGHVNLIPRI